MIAALARAGSEVTVVNRSPDRARAAVALAGERSRVGDRADVASASILVNATSVGMGGAGVVVPADLLSPTQVVVDLVYHPIETPLLTAARARGARAIDGVGMLVHQAALAFTLWTGAEPPIQTMNRAARAALGDRERSG